MNMHNKINITLIALFFLGALLWTATADVRAYEPNFFQMDVLFDEAKGVVKVRSNNSFNKTVEKLETAIKANAALKIVAKIDHAANAASVDQELRPTVLFIFGSPQMGTPLMAAAQSAALDLPQKMIVFEDEKGGVFVAYNDPAFIATRHGIAVDHPAVESADTGLGNLAKAATTK
jgi:uncharacterized protein (DUF302 family)